MRYFFPIHLDGGNRGCEAIAKGTAILINEPAEHLYGYCSDVSLDTTLGVSQHITLIPYSQRNYIKDKFLAVLKKLIHTEKTSQLRELYPYRSFLNMIKKDDIMVSTGGDMMCYGNNSVIYTNNYLHDKGIKTVLWGCSMGAENMTKEKKKTLFNFSLIYTRESLTYNYFKSLGLNNVCMCPDPAFILPAEPWNIPQFLSDGDVIGINISNYVMGGMTLDTPFAKEVMQLINYIISKTKFNIMLIPHVTWNKNRLNQDDREMAEIIRYNISYSNRINILNIDTLNYCQIRYAISQCRMFIGSRTHAVISAYAMCVPTIAIGYSIKSVGIAKDLQLNKTLVVDCRIPDKGALMKSYIYLTENETRIREHLMKIMPEYIQSTYRIRDFLTNIITENK